MRISDWSSDVCSSDLNVHRPLHGVAELHVEELRWRLLADARRVRQRARYQLAPFVSGTLGAGLLAVKDRQSVVSGKSVSVLFVLGVRRFIYKNHIFFIYIYNTLLLFFIIFFYF